MLKANGPSNTTFVGKKAEDSDLYQPKDGVKESSNITTMPVRTTVIDNERVPKQYLLMYAEGSSWPTKAFYRRLAGKDDPKSVFDSTISTPQQQYEKINFLELRVTSPLARTQDSQTKLYTRTGSAVVINSVPVNEGDVFVVDMGDGRDGLFTVTSSNRPSDNKISVYEIEYSMLMQVNPYVQNILDTCTAHEFFYVKERAWMNEDTLLTPDEYHHFISVDDRIRDIQQVYVRRFWDRNFNSIGIPNQTYRTYDVFFAAFVKAIGLYVPGKDIVIYPHPPKPVSDVETVWRCMLQRTPLLLADTNREMVALAPRTFKTTEVRNNIAWSNVQQTLYFSDDYPCGQQALGCAPTFEPVTGIEITYMKVEGKSLPAYLTPTLTPYVFSQAFYDGGYASVLEYCMFLYLNKRPAPVDLVIYLAELVLKLPRSAQFYYMPVVYAMLNYVR